MILFLRFLLSCSFDIYVFNNADFLTNILRYASDFQLSSRFVNVAGITQFLVFDVVLVVQTLTPALNCVTAVVVRRNAFVAGFISRILRENNRNEA